MDALKMGKERKDQILKMHGKTLRTRRHVICVCFILFWVLAANLLVADMGQASVTDGVVKEKLANGLTVLLKEDHSAPVVSVQVWVKTGSANETEKEAGITHLIEHMIFKGTPTRKTGEIARTIESSGGHINAYTTYDRTVYFVEIASAHFDTAVDVLLDAVQHSLFDPDEIRREKEVVLEEYRRSLDRPTSRLSWALMKLCYQKHPYRRPVIGYESTIRSFNREMILKYIDKWYTPDNMVVVAVGDFEDDHALATVKAAVKDFPKHTGQKPAREPEPEQTSLRKLILSEDVQQAYLDLSWHIPSLDHEDMPVIDLLEIILGDGKSSRLYDRLKMKGNLVHSIGAGAYSLVDPGLFSVDATLDSQELKPALSAIGEEVREAGLRPPSPEELARAKTLAEADFLFSMENMSGQAKTLAFFEAMAGDMNRSDRYLEKIKAVTPEDVQRVAKKYLRPDNLSIGLMAPKEAKVAFSKDQLADLLSGKEAASPRAKATGRKFAVTTLPNGMRVIIKENHRLPLVSLTAAFLGGTRLEGPDRWGISGLTAKMLTRGTEDKSAAEIASLVESWAGSLEGFSGRNSFGVSAKFLTKDLYRGLNLMAEVILHPSFPASELEKAREDILAGIRAKKDKPSTQVFDLFNKTLYQQHPYGHPQSGTQESVRGLTRSAIVSWYRRLAVPSNMVLCIVGDVETRELTAHLQDLFKDFTPAEGLDLPHIAPEPPLEGVRTAHLETDGAQSHLVLGYLGVDLKSPDNAPMALIDTALSGLGGKLFHELRDKKSLAYVVNAFRSPGLETGVFGVYLACAPSKTAVAEEEIIRTIEKIREDGLTEEELTSAKNYLLGNMKIGLQTNGSQCLQMALNELYGLGADYTERYMKKIEAVTPADIKRAAAKIITPGKYTFVTLGPTKPKSNKG